MTGKLCTHRRYEEAPAGAKLTLYFDGDEGLDALTLVNTRMFGSCWAVLGEPERDREACEEQSRLHFEEAVKLAKMGPDALELARNPPAWISHLRGVSTRRPVKSILLDQEVVAGIGNIYAVEALFYAGVHPSAQLSNVSDDQLRALANRVVSAMEWTLKRAEEEGRVVYGEGRGERSPFTVYGREGLPCTRCESTLMNLQLGGRQTVFCPSCQPSINS